MGLEFSGFFSIYPTTYTRYFPICLVLQSTKIDRRQFSKVSRFGLGENRLFKCVLRAYLMKCPLSLWCIHVYDSTFFPHDLDVDGEP